MMLTLGTGIGVALLVDGRSIGVIGGTLGDAGHVAVDPAGARSCRMGCRGCLESVASGVALIEIAEELAEAAPTSALGALHRGAGITGAELARLAAAGDRPTLDLLAETGRWLGMGLGSFSNTFAPDVVCIGGGMSRFRLYLEAALLEGSESGRIKSRPGPETIYFSAEYERAASRGAVTLFLNTEEPFHG
jgi:glucokinase